MAKSVAVLAVFLTVSALSVPAIAVDNALFGRASVIDGDTVEIDGERVRLNGIDAPESWQICADAAGAGYHCGKVSAEALDTFLATSRPTRCQPVSKDRYGRTVADCFRADGKSVNAWLVRFGHALDWPQYSHGKFAGEQAAARSGRLGMWQGDFLPPWTARRLGPRISLP